MTHHPAGNVHLRHKRLPEGFTRYKRGSGAKHPTPDHRSEFRCPCEPTDYVELMVRTSHGFGSSGILRAHNIDWSMGEKGGLGEIVAYRVINTRGGEQ